jgi:hypothetical protein
MKLYQKIAIILLMSLSIGAAENDKRNIENWIEIERPPESCAVDMKLWFLRGTHSRHEWVVRKEKNAVIADIRVDEVERKVQPTFKCNVDNFQEGDVFCQTDNGWIVGFNKGEWGGALYWFSFDGRENRKISNHQIVDFLSYKGRLFAIEGLAHLDISRGSIIEIVSNRDGSEYSVVSLFNLPEAPQAAAFMSNGNLLLALFDALAL